MISPDYQHQGLVVGVRDIPIPFNNQNVTDATNTNSVATSLLELANIHASGLGSLASGMANSTPGAVAEQNVVKRPWIDEPEGSEPFDLQNGVALPGVGPGFTLVLQLVVPEGYDGVIKGLSWNFTGGGFVQFSGDIVIQILRNGAAIRNFDNILNEKGSFQFPRLISPIRVFSNQIITLQVSHVANALLVGDIVATFAGYIYPSKG